MRVTRIYHSCFVIELEHCTLLFDWWRGRPRIPADKPVYVFVSHAHADHYSAVIWSLPDAVRVDITYVLDQDVARLAPKGVRVVAMGPHETRVIDDLAVTTLKSTDEGVAFLVKTEAGETVYHAGDHTTWWWLTRDEGLNRLSDLNCREELRRIAGTHVDAACLPMSVNDDLDPIPGLLAYCEEVGARAVFPMHYHDDRAGAARLVADPRLDPYRHLIHLEDSAEI